VRRPEKRKVPSELRRLLDTSPDAVVLVNRAGIIVSLNRRAEAMFGAGARKLRGHPVEVLLPARFRAAHGKARAEYGKAPTLRAMSARGGLMGQRADGAEFPVEVSLTPVAGSSEGLVMAVVHDVSTRTRVAAAIGPAGRVTEALDAIPDAVLVTDAAGKLDFLNRSAEELTGHRLASARGFSLGAVLPLAAEPEERLLSDRIASCLGEGAPTEAWEVVLPPIPGREPRTLDVSIGPLRNGSGAITGAAIIARDVTHARHIAKELAHQATHDPLTGLVNRSEFERRLTRALAGTEGGEHALCFLDLDGFKAVNDTCGHFAGDELLRQLSALMRERLRARDTLARLGGDEFGLLLEHCGLTRAARVADEIRKAITGHRFTFGEATYRVGVSIGIVPVRPGGRPREVLREADTACYVAKRAGGNRIQVQDLRVSPVAASRTGEWLQSVLRAAEESRLRLYAQPLVPLAGGNGVIPRLELLLRLDNGHGELVPPAGFLPTARRHGLMPAVDGWVVRRAAEELSRWQRAHPGADPPTVAVNLADETVAGGDAVAMISQVLEGTTVPGKALCVEIGESTVIADPTRAAELLRGLRAAGCQTAVEHCGTGMAAFTLLQGLALDYLKIAGHVVRGLARDPVARILGSALNQIGHSLGLRTIGAEAEDEGAIVVLREIGVDLVQGFCVGRPGPFEAALDSLDAVLSECLAPHPKDGGPPR
jgi:diguanylate cyclase (GGDEF)-like protein/PAS domain S-box-containing protein